MAFKRRLKFDKRIKFKKKMSIMYILLFVVMLSLGTGYAYIKSDLNINGTAKIKNARFDVHFANLNVTSGSVTATTPASITDTTTVGFVATLENPNDYYEFTVDVVNNGTMDAMIDDFTISPNLTTAQKKYLEYQMTYSDGTELGEKQELKVGTTETLKARFNYIENEDKTNYPTEDQTFTVAFTVDYTQADSSAIAVSSIMRDSWSTIIENVSNNNISSYKLGDTKEVDLGSLGVHTLRVANLSTPSECSTTGFSQTACGFVLEFTDIITNHRMNPNIDGDTTTIGVNNKGGWKYSDMRAFLNSTTYAYEGIDYSSTGIYSSLPSELRNAIIDTTVVSGYGPNDTENFVTTDKLYLLTPKEVFGVEATYDKAHSLTRHLDYYEETGVTDDEYWKSIKYYNGEAANWFLRTAYYYRPYLYYAVDDYGGYWADFGYANCEYGVSPAFRIG